MPKVERFVEQPAASLAEPWPRREVRVGIIGYGTVGRATAEILASHAQEIRQRTGGISVVVTRICRKSPHPSDKASVTHDWREVVNDPEVDIVVEAIGGIETACQVVRAGLE